MSKSRVTLLALFISLALNLFFVGGILYRMSNFREFGPRPMPPNVSWIVRDLPETRQAQLEPLLERNRSDARSLRREMFEAQRMVNDLMANEDYNAERLEQAFDSLRSASLRYQELSHQLMLQILGELSAQERAAAREFMQRRGPRDGFDNHRGRQSRPPF